MAAGLFDLSGKVAVVTGAGANGGIGHAIVVGFAQHGADLFVSDIDEPGVNTAAAEIRQLGRRHRASALPSSWHPRPRIL